MLADLSTCFSWLCFKLSLKFCKWIYFFIVVHCKQPGLFSMCYIKEPFKHWTLSAWIEPWGSLTWLKCCVLMMERMVLGVVWEKFLYLDNIKRDIALPFIQQLKFPFLFPPFFLRGGSCGFVFLPTPQIYSETSVFPDSTLWNGWLVSELGSCRKLHISWTGLAELRDEKD